LKEKNEKRIKRKYITQNLNKMVLQKQIANDPIDEKEIKEHLTN